METSFFDEFEGAVTVCNTSGEIIYMNQHSAKVFEKDGGFRLIGRNLKDCHPETARKKLDEMLLHPKSNAYTIEKNGVKKLIFQSPWYKQGKFAGLIELSLVIPFDMPHFVRSKPDIKSQ